MTVLRRSEITYFIGKEVVTIQYNQQFIAFTTYRIGHNKLRFNQFVESLIHSKREQYSSLNDLFGLARKYELVATIGFRPKNTTTLEKVTC